eukprot:758274-Hanusia_phi.AAC.1
MGGEAGRGRGRERERGRGCRGAEEDLLTLGQLEASAMVVSSLDEVAWLLNVRGSDIPFNPFVVSYVILTMEEVKWWSNISVQACKRMGSQSSPTAPSRVRLGVSPATCDELLRSEHLLLLSRSERGIVIDPANLKAIKSNEELQGFQTAHLKVVIVLFIPVSSSCLSLGLPGCSCDGELSVLDREGDGKQRESD